MPFLRSLVESGIDAPALRERPTLEPHLWYFRDIYDDIAGSRHYTANGDPLPVPISEVLAYCELFRIHGLEEREKLLQLVRAMDRAFLDVIRKKQETKDKKPRPKPVK